MRCGNRRARRRSFRWAEAAHRDRSRAAQATENLIFDEATSNLDPTAAEHIARTINGLKGKATLLFMSHEVPKSLAADEAIRIAEPLPQAIGQN